MQAGACGNESIPSSDEFGSVWKMDPRLTAVARHRIRIRSVATSTRSGHG